MKQLNLGPHGRLRFEISELPAHRYRLTLEAVVAGKVIKQLDRRDFDNLQQTWRAVAEFGADRQAEFALRAAESQRR
ncbi:MAG: hypothetical protein M0R28_17940 [Pigmentiphaga sp.]|nr:hypothetical protein [Pigmentiphaga sp.]